MGVSGSEAAEALSRDPETLVGYSMVGCQRAMMANRLSFFFDFKGRCPHSPFVSDSGPGSGEAGRGRMTAETLPDSDHTFPGKASRSKVLVLWVPHGEQSVELSEPQGGGGGRRSHSCTASLPAGPSITLDTACSSSLLALQRAYQAIQRGECAMAIVGGINILLKPNTSLQFMRLGMLSSEGTCKSFDASGEGIGHGAPGSAPTLDSVWHQPLSPCLSS